MTFIDSDRILVSSVFSNGTAHCWSLESGATLHVLSTEDVWEVAGSTHHPFFLATSISESWVCNAITGSRWRLVTRNDLYALAGEADDHPGWTTQECLQGVVFTPSGRSFITGGGEDDGITVWDIGPVIDLWKDNKKQLESIWVEGMVWKNIPGPQVGSTTSQWTPC